MSFSEAQLLAYYQFEDQHPILVDVGAHRGSFARTYVEKGWRVIAFEPERRNLEYLKNDLGQYSRVDIINKAIHEQGYQKVPFYVSDIYHGIHALKPFDDTHYHAYDVETIRLDDALEQMGIMNLSLLKIDVEGSDLFALRSIDLDKFRPEIIIVEFADNRSLNVYGYSYRDMVEFAQNHGYLAFVSEWSSGDSYASDNIRPNYQWLGCHKYPLAHEPAWGNLIFIPTSDEEKFRNTLSAYLEELESQAEYSQTIIGLTKSRLKKYGKRIPGAKRIYRRVYK